MSLVVLLRIVAILVFTFAVFEFVGPLKDGRLPEAILPYLLLFGAIVLFGSARIVGRQFGGRF